MPAIGWSSPRIAADGDVAAVELLAQRLEALDGLRLQAAVGQFLDAVGQPALQEAAIVGRRLGVEESRHCCFRSGVGDALRAASRASTLSVIIMPFSASRYWHDGFGRARSRANCLLGREIKNSTFARLAG